VVSAVDSLGRLLLVVSAVVLGSSLVMIVQKQLFSHEMIE